MKELHEGVVVSVSFRDKNDGLLCVGKHNEKGVMEVINAFQDEEAWALYEKLTIPKGEPRCL